MQDYSHCYDWPDPEENPPRRTWVHEVLKNGVLLTTDNHKRLGQIVKDEYFYGIPKGGNGSHFDLLPKLLLSGHGGGGLRGRYWKLVIADPIRTDVLCHLATRATLEWIAQEYPPARFEIIKLGDDYGEQARACVVKDVLEKVDLDHELHALHERQFAWRTRVATLIDNIREDEIQAFRKALRMYPSNVLLRFPNNPAPDTSL